MKVELLNDSQFDEGRMCVCVCVVEKRGKNRITLNRLAFITIEIEFHEEYTQQQQLDNNTQKESWVKKEKERKREKKENHENYRNKTQT